MMERRGFFAALSALFSLPFLKKRHEKAEPFRTYSDIHHGVRDAMNAHYKKTGPTHFADDTRPFGG